MPDKTFTMRLSIDADEYRKLYAGSASDVVARATNGQTLRFPASALRRFVSHEGIRGVFEICVTDDNRLVSIRRQDS